MEIEPLAPVKLSDECSPSQYLDCNLIKNPESRTSQLSLSHIPDPQTLKNNKHSLFKLLDLGVICHTIIDNKYTFFMALWLKVCSSPGKEPQSWVWSILGLQGPPKNPEAKAQTTNTRPGCLCAHRPFIYPRGRRREDEEEN